MPEPSIRRYAPPDLDALYEICLRTGAAGEDATDLMQDPRLLGALYAAPYATYAPDLAFVVDDGAGTAGGYVLGARDTASFATTLEREWWPSLRARHPEARRTGGLDDLFVTILHHPSQPSDDVLEAFPSHLHIDLLAPFQGAGWGRRLLERLFDELRSLGSPGVHLGVNRANTRALGFYDHLGFTLLHEDATSRTLGHTL